MGAFEVFRRIDEAVNHRDRAIAVTLSNGCYSTSPLSTGEPGSDYTVTRSGLAENLRIARYEEGFFPSSTKRQLRCAKNRSNFAGLFNVSQSHRLDCNTWPPDTGCRAVKSAGTIAGQNSREDRCTQSNIVWAVSDVGQLRSSPALPS